VPISSKKIYHWTLLIALAFIWGSSFILMKKGLVVFSDFEVAQFRMALAWLSLLPFVWKKIWKIDKKHIFPIIIVGLFGNGIPAFLFPISQTKLDSSLVGILNALVPIFTLAIALLFFKIKIKRSQIIGLAIGLLGATSIIAYGGINLDNIHYSYLVICATICYAISLNTIKFSLQDMKAIDIAGIAFFVVGPICLGALVCSDVYEKINTHNENLEAFLYIILLSTVGTSLALVMFNHLVKETTAIFASSVTYLIPIVAILWGFIDGETISLIHIISIVIILSGIYLINKTN